MCVIRYFFVNYRFLGNILFIYLCVCLYNEYLLGMLYMLGFNFSIGIGGWIYRNCFYVYGDYFLIVGGGRFWWFYFSSKD